MNKLTHLLSWLFKVTAFFVILECVHYLTSCSSFKDNTIPTEPTIWIVSEIHQDKRLKNYLSGYLITPINPGTINMRPIWILDYSGKYYVGQKVEFCSLPDDATRLIK
jgi:hypothetical protein